MDWGQQSQAREWQEQICPVEDHTFVQIRGPECPEKNRIIWGASGWALLSQKTSPLWSRGRHLKVSEVFKKQEKRPWGNCQPWRMKDMSLPYRDSRKGRLAPWLSMSSGGRRQADTSEVQPWPGLFPLAPVLTGQNRGTLWFLSPGSEP